MVHDSYFVGLIVQKSIHEANMKYSVVKCSCSDLEQACSQKTSKVYELLVL